MPKELQLEEDGYLDLKVPVQGQPEPLTVRLDIDRASDVLATAARESGDDGKLWAEKLQQAMGDLGVPPLSHHNYLRICRAVWDASEELQKKDDATRSPVGGPGSPGTST